MRSLFVALLLVAGCETEGIWVVPDLGLERMVSQPRYEAYEVNPMFDDRRAMRRPPEGTVPREARLDRPALELGRVDGDYVDAIPLDVDLDLVRRGQDRFDVFCAPCHGADGYGASAVTANMPLVKPASLHSERVRGFPSGRVYQVIREGYGLMPAYRAQLPVEDRWAVVSYVQALQLSRRAPLEGLPQDLRRAVEEAAR